MNTTKNLLRDVERRLRESARGDLIRAGVKPQFDGGDLVLGGEVPDVGSKKLALERAAAAPGVDIIIDRLHVRAQQRPDQAVLADILGMLGRDPALSDCFVPRAPGEAQARAALLSPEGFQGAIEVYVASGVVTLDGEVPTLLHKRLAGALAWSVPGCRDVVNGLEVVPAEPDEPAKLALAAVVAFTRLRPAAARDVHVRANGATLTLVGQVPFSADARALERIAWSLFGVDLVESGIQAVA